MSEPTTRYNLGAPVGEGAMGSVLRATDTSLGREVAFKRIHPEQARRRGMLSRFVQEARITARLDHPHIVPVYGLEPAPDGTPAYAMKLVQGRNFDEILEESAKGGPHALPLAARLEVFLKVCDAVHFAHSRGVVHRDLKPANVMVGAFHEVYVMDWGLAKELAGEEQQILDLPTGKFAARMHQTRFGTVIGTPAYMSPEQARGDNGRVDARSDQFALGLMLYEVVTCRHALDGDTESIIASLALDAYDPIGRNGHHVPGDLAAIIRQATRYGRSERYETVEQLAADVRRVMDGEPPSVRPDTAWRSAVRGMGRHRAAALAALLGVLMLALAFVIGAFALLFADRADARAREAALGALLTDVTSAAADLDEELLRLQGLTEGLASVAAATLTRGEPTEGPVYFDTAFSDLANAPRDLRAVPAHPRMVSFEHPVVRLAPDASAEALDPEIRRLVRLTPDLRRVFLASAGTPTLGLEMGEQNRVLAQGTPVVGAYVATETGVHVSWPGHGGYPADYDPRLRPWYLAGRDGYGARWGPPHEDVNGQGALLVCSAPVRDPERRLRGVAGVEVPLGPLVTRFRDAMTARGVVSSWVLDAQGRVMVDSRSLEVALTEPRPFGVAAVTEGVRARRSSYHRDNEALYAWAPLDSLGWWLVVGDEGARR